MKNLPGKHLTNYVQGCYPGLFNKYQINTDSYDELFSADISHDGLEQIILYFDNLNSTQFATLHQQAQEILRKCGVTFRVYDNNKAKDHTFPLDLLPRIINKHEWLIIQKGLKQRVLALNEFLLDIYGKEHALRDKIIPRELIVSSSGYMPLVRGVVPPGRVYMHISGIDLVRNSQGEFLVLEDNLRVPSGVSYALENRRLMTQLFSPIFDNLSISNINNYPEKLKQSFVNLENTKLKGQNIVLLTPGPFNAAYFEHKFLAQKLNCDLVMGQDLLVERDIVYCKKSRKRIDIIYRRVDDDFLDPSVFNSQSLLGVSGLFQAYSKGNVMLANALGNGVADDKSIFAYIPLLIRYYLGEEPILKQVETYNCANNEQKKYIISNLSTMVVKLVDQSGGYGMLIGPQASQKELADMRQRILASPRSYIAQPLVELSSCATFDPVSHSICSRRVDLRPYCILGNDVYVMPGGLTRVALKPDSYVVNSSQGGGSKDTWVLI